MALIASKSVARSGLRVVLLAVALLLTAAGAATVFAHFHYPKTFQVALKLDPPCDSAGLVRVGGHNWVGGLIRANWSSPVHGAFKMISPHRAVFTADQGGQESFTFLPTGEFWNLSCPIR